METRWSDKRPIAPLAVLRIAFGAILFISTLRFILKGWVDEFYVQPGVHFPFYGFEWLHPLPPAGMHLVFGVMLAAALFITIGLFYRTATILFLLCFVYVELLDKTYYLNHYYFVSVFTFLLLFVPANRSLSLDVRRKPTLELTHVPAWTILIFQAQLILVYFFAGLSKLTPDWLIHAMPLRIWLPANTTIPLLDKVWVAYTFSWFGAIFDLTIGFFLVNRKTRPIAYFFVVIFHILTAWLFKIGMFPWIMITATLIFWDFKSTTAKTTVTWAPKKQKVLALTLILYFTVQILLPFRYLLYPGHLFWTEQGYRFSWRVMLMEKAGTAFFYVKDPLTGKKGEINNRQFLTPFQERQMSTQPDMILQYAHYLENIYQQKGFHNPQITVESYVTLNGSGSRLFIDSTIDLGHQPDNLLPKTWILPFQQNK
ncbi:MAG TPA: HTTM domain-containing protein [Puia sp.]|nr:HTTM domain-containing protein [Puia sp.]